MLVNPEAESYVIGALLSEPERFPEARAIVSAEDFTEREARLAFAAMTASWDAGEVIDIAGVRAGMVLRGGESYQTSPYLYTVAANVPFAMHLGHYARLVRSCALRRQLQAAGQRIVKAAEDPQQPLPEALALSTQALEAVSLTQPQPLVPLATVLEQTLEALEAGPASFKGPETGMQDLDALIGYLPPGGLVTVAARPACGKSALAVTVALHIARGGGRVLLFSLEMSAEEIARRLLCMEGHLNSSRLRNATFSASEWGRLVQAAGALSTLELYIDDTAALTPSDLRARAHLLHAQDPVTLVIVDYLQLMGSGRAREENRVQEVSYLTRTLKVLAKELHVPVLALSQMNRAIENRADHIPQLSDLRECVTGDTLLTDMRTGQRIPIRDLAAGTLIMSQSGQRTVPALVRDVWSTGIKPVFAVTLQTGRCVRATANHPFLTQRGWVRLDELRSTDRIATLLKRDQGRSVGRAVARSWAERTGDPILWAWAYSDFCWESVKSITPDGEEEVFDLSVPETGCFVGNGVVLHNSGSIEQDSDIIIFLSKESMYNKESEKADIVDLYVAKNRNGPVGQLELFYNGPQTRFVDIPSTPSPAIAQRAHESLQQEEETMRAHGLCLYCGAPPGHQHDADCLAGAF